mmetsp:Transcript_28702/g.44979  ORF Transcript_28702/g.44979 Transcript_28702/m.44979 type:complete len:297 (+) Transcript_28702:231-1121(+)
MGVSVSRASLGQSSGSYRQAPQGFNSAARQALVPEQSSRISNLRIIVDAPEQPEMDETSLELSDGPLLKDTRTSTEVHSPPSQSQGAAQRPQRLQPMAKSRSRLKKGSTGHAAEQPGATHNTSFSCRGSFLDADKPGPRDESPKDAQFDSESSPQNAPDIFSPSVARAPGDQRNRSLGQPQKALQTQWHLSLASKASNENSNSRDWNIPEDKPQPGADACSQQLPALNPVVAHQCSIPGLQAKHGVIMASSPGKIVLKSPVRKPFRVLGASEANSPCRKVLGVGVDGPDMVHICVL